tara:strand:- start:3527 stop:5047 length:1521 start_codon:yes stop_codon:yes gene_type:complete
MGVSKQKVVLFLPKPRKHTYDNSLPLGLLKLASMIDRKKYDIKLISVGPDRDYKAEIVEESKDAVCVAAGIITGYPILEAVDIVKRIRKVSPNVPVVWGGWHTSLFPQDTLESGYADIVVKGQGERAFSEVVDALAEKKTLRGLPGISFRDKNGKIVHNPPREFEDVNNFPPMPFDLINFEDYITDYDGMRAVSYVASQGCPFACTFCSNATIFKQRWSAISNDKILNDWKFFAEKGVEMILVCDDNFMVNEKKVNDFCKRLIALKLPLKWSKANGRVRRFLSFNDDTWKLIKKSGCTDIEIGAESGLQSTLDYINKQLNVDEIVNFIEKARQYKLPVVSNWLLGIPTKNFKGATQEQIETCLDEEWEAMLVALDRCYGKHKDYEEIRVCAYYPYPGNQLYDFACEIGFKPPKDLEDWGRLHTIPWFSDERKERIKMLLYFIFPYARDGYLQRHSKYMIPLHIIFHYTAMLRWKYHFFGFPLDYKLYRALTNLRMRLTGKTATDHE